jgi:hypothetical protein
MSMRCDIALFYYVGHGQIDLDNQLYLGLGDTKPEINRRTATSLPFQAIRRALLDSPAATKIVILDCCFAGLANLPANTLSGVPADVLDMAAGSGAYTTAASAPYTAAWYNTSPDNDQPQIFFTRYFVDLVEAGIPGQPSGLRLHPLFSHMHDNLALDRLPIPSERSIDAARDFVFAYNAAPLEAHRDLDREVQELSHRLAEAEALRAQALTKAITIEQALPAEIAERLREIERLQGQKRSTLLKPPGEQPASIATAGNIDTDVAASPPLRESSSTSSQRPESSARQATTQADARSAADSVNLAFSRAETQGGIHPATSVTAPVDSAHAFEITDPKTAPPRDQGNCPPAFNSHSLAPKAVPDYAPAIGADNLGDVNGPSTPNPESLKGVPAETAAPAVSLAAATPVKPADQALRSSRRRLWLAVSAVAIAAATATDEMESPYMANMHGSPPMTHPSLNSRSAKACGAAVGTCGEGA